MKKFLVLLLFVSFFVFMSAQTVTEQEAIDIAENFMFKNNSFLSSKKSTISHYKHKKDFTTIMYIVNFESGGWVLVSGDKRVNPILAYSNEGNVDKRYSSRDAVFS